MDGVYERRTSRNSFPVVVVCLSFVRRAFTTGCWRMCSFDSDIVAVKGKDLVEVRQDTGERQADGGGREGCV